jgi:hypothetical protein
MITNFKSDYGNLLLSGLKPPELNIPGERSGENFYDPRCEKGPRPGGGGEKGLKLQLQSCALSQTTAEALGWREA